MKTRVIAYLIVLSLFAYNGDIWAFTEGASNNFFGTSAGASNTSGGGNTFVGANAGLSNTSGLANTYYGFMAGRNNSSGSDNTLIGVNSGYSIAGINNTIVGSGAGFSATGTGNVFLGYRAGFIEPGNNKLYIDNSDTGTPLIYGEFDNDFVEINGDLYITGNTYVDSDEQLKKDIKPIESSLNKILVLQGISYKWKEERIDGGQTSDRKHYGVIAQQVEDVLPEIVNKGQDDKKRVAYMELIPVLIEAMKEQQEIISELSHKVQNLENELQLKGHLAVADIN